MTKKIKLDQTTLQWVYEELEAELKTSTSRLKEYLTDALRSLPRGKHSGPMDNARNRLEEARMLLESYYAWADMVDHLKERAKECE